MSTIWDLQERFDAATTDAERENIRTQLREAGASGVAETIGHPPADQPGLIQAMRARRGW